MSLIASERAVKQLLSFFPPTQAMSQKAYTAAMVQLFSNYPESVIAEAIDPAHGLPCMSEFAPSLKAAKEFLEKRATERWKTSRQFERRQQQLIEATPRDPEMVARVNAGFAQLVEQLKAKKVPLGEAPETKAEG